MEKTKRELLLTRIDELTEKDLFVAFSGGVDSSLLLHLTSVSAKKHHTKVYAVMILSELNPVSDLTIAKETAAAMETEFLSIPVHELEETEIRNNPINRCYLCKKYLFEKIEKKAKELKIEKIIEGTNADDLSVYRPGLQAVKELGIESPLAEAGFTKEDVRFLAKELGIPTADRPSTPCLATRFPYGTTLNPEVMKKIEAGEQYLRKLGLYNVRIRVYDSLLRIETDLSSMNLVLKQKESIISYLKGLGFSYVTLDLEGFRSGSMDINVQ